MLPVASFRLQVAGKNKCRRLLRLREASAKQGQVPVTGTLLQMTDLFCYRENQNPVTGNWKPVTGNY
jgi:hypothetical protein